MGEIHLLAIWERDGLWEPEWEPLRGTRVGDQFSCITQSVLDHALIKHFKPLVDSLGIPPEGALRKLPKEGRVCARRVVCPLYTTQCHPLSKSMPWCYEPDGFSEEVVRKAVSKAIEYWREGVYLTVVTSI